jgi:hypothetical protein
LFGSDPAGDGCIPPGCSSAFLLAGRGHNRSINADIFVSIDTLKCWPDSCGRTVQRTHLLVVAVVVAVEQSSAGGDYPLLFCRKIAHGSISQSLPCAEAGCEVDRNPWLAKIQLTTRIRRQLTDMALDFMFVTGTISIESLLLLLAAGEFSCSRRPLEQVAGVVRHWLTRRPVNIRSDGPLFDTTYF